MAKSIVCILPLIIFISITYITNPGECNTCEAVWGNGPKGTLDECNKKDGGFMANVPIFKSVHCFNNGSGLCKGLAGRFELLFNVFDDKIIGPYVGNRSHVDSNGYHERIPIAYNTKGEVVYSDRVINWANEYTRNLAASNLLNLGNINWCSYVEADNWPYRSAIKDPLSGNRFHIYFFNKQSCIIENGKISTQYNTRFTHKSTFRVDQDMNPLIFVMEDNQANDPKFRMVKNKRQHWTETEYKVIGHPTRPGRHFIKIEDSETQPQIIKNGRHILSTKAYFETNETVKLCLTDSYMNREPPNDPSRNSQLLQHHCSLDEVEMADRNLVSKNIGGGTVYEADLHCLPKHPPDSESFFGVNFSDMNNWLAFANDGLAFSAFTTMPGSNSTSVNVIMMYAKFQTPEDEYDENYPKPYIANYTSNYEKGVWYNDRDANSNPRTDMNFVDDIAYLPKCKTILIVLGPLYSEMTADNLLDPNATSLIGSIYDLGVWEMTNAFFAVDEDIYFYHRTNYIVQHKYTCGSNDGKTKLMTATRNGKYLPRHGAGMPSIFPKTPRSSDDNSDFTYFEETFFQKMGFFNGGTNSPEAPDPKLYPYDKPDEKPPPPEASNLWLYLIIGLAILIILTMCIIYMATRRRRRRRQKEADKLAKLTQRSSGLGNRSGVSGAQTNRSGMSEASGGGASSVPKTFRSGNISQGTNKPEFSKSSVTKAHGSNATTSTHRSGLSSSRKNSPGSSASRASSKATGRSGLTKTSSSSPHSPGRSRSHSRSRSKK